MLSVPEMQQMKIKDISKVSGMSVASVYNIRRATFPDFYGGPLKDYPILKRGRKKKDLSNIESKILGLLKDDNTLTINEIMQNMPDGCPIKGSTISKYIKKFGWSKKMAYKELDNRINDPEVMTTRKTYCSKMLNTAMEKLFFFDETSIYIKDTPVYAWAPFGVIPSIVIPRYSDKCVSFLCTIGIKGLVNYRILEGSYKAAILMDYMTDLVNILPSDAIIMMDNAPIHTSDLMDGFKGRIEYIPPHSPQLNPIKSFFDVIKTKFEAIHPRPATRADIISNISIIMTQYDKHSFSDFYTDMRKFLEIDV
ncbi:uncharacterized protein LOC135926231 [Gordionus sp. m RMFG-2023]|uniref:uncharacterized protein LOC135926231 n=1 Tax=Gordionus sp. m RMFG-2023 TaxID=3053472 RepID=UPI0031FBE6D3